MNCARHGKEALELMASDTAHVILLDAVMPLVDGIEFLEVLRCYLRWQQTPVVMLTAHADGPHIRRAVELGVRKTFLKGDYDLKELGAYVGALALGAQCSAQGWVPMPYHD